MSQQEQGGVSRRGLLAGAGAVVGGAAVGGVGLGVGAAQAAPLGVLTTPAAPRGFGPVSVRPGDPRYENLLRGNNFRFVGHPDEVRVVASTEQVVAAVADAVRARKRIAVRSGGHCFE